MSEYEKYEKYWREKEENEKQVKTIAEMKVQYNYNLTDIKPISITLQIPPETKKHKKDNWFLWTLLLITFTFVGFFIIFNFYSVFIFTIFSFLIVLTWIIYYCRIIKEKEVK